MGVDRLLVGLARPLITRTFRRVLHGRLPPGKAKEVVACAWPASKKLLANQTPEPTIGARTMVRLAALAVSLYRLLCGAGLDDDEALRLTSVGTWLVYRRLAWPAWKLTRLFARNRLVRMNRAMDAFMRFPYARPGYAMDYTATSKDVVGFDVHRCPVAVFFETQGLSKLCVASFCDLDFPLATEWGVKLERTTTLAQGSTKCDFRYRS